MTKYLIIPTTVLSLYKFIGCVYIYMLQTLPTSVFLNKPLGLWLEEIEYDLKAAN